MGGEWEALDHINGRNWPTSGFSRSVSVMGAGQYSQGMYLFVTLRQTRLIPMIKTCFALKNYESNAVKC
jgi:hypothetical protein